MRRRRLTAAGSCGTALWVACCVALLRHGRPAGAVVDEAQHDHCRLTTGNWCGSYFKQEATARPPPKRGSLPCPLNCTSGNCNHDTGRCHCPAGWGGSDCTTPRRRKCLNMGTDKMDIGLADYDQWSHTRCSGMCDDETAMCYCPPGTKFGTVPAPEGSLPWARPAQWGRPLFMCNPNTDADGREVKWGSEPRENIFDKKVGWCEAEIPKWQCPCRIDGLLGQMCNIVNEMTCQNQCSGHGDCYLGFCKCHEGWYGQTCDRLRAGLPMAKEPGQHVLDHPWLAPAITPVVAAQDPPTHPTRKRPFIYVYDMPPEFTTDLLQYRIERTHCQWRIFEFKNASNFIGFNAYSVEPVLHELFLTSEHRTLDPDEADFFYIPTLTACVAMIYGNNGHPMWPPGSFGTRAYGMSGMTWYAHRWLLANSPHYKRSGGRDHIWLWAHDEGACYANVELWPGIMLTNWGRTDFPHSSQTSYGPDDYNREERHPEYPNGWRNVSSLAHPCYDPNKDLVIPVYKPPTHYEKSPYLGGTIPGGKRDILFSFRGDLGLTREGCAYSRCLRQRLYNISVEQQWHARYNIWYCQYDMQPCGHTSYSEIMSRSTFCLVLPGDGWSARYEDSILNGCIPIIILDDVHGPFGSIIDYSKFAVQVAQKDIETLAPTIAAIPQDRVRQLADGVNQIWTRFRYKGLRMIDESEAKLKQHNMDERGGSAAPMHPGSELAGTNTDDAFSTIIQWLYSKLPYAAEVKGPGSGSGSEVGVTAAAAARQLLSTGAAARTLLH